jgi:hypothetical protein
MGTFDIITVLRRELPALNIPASTLASLTNSVSSSRLSKYLNGSERCGGEHYEQLQKAWNQLKKLIQFSDPLPLDYRKVDKLRESLDAMEAGSLRIIVYNETEMKEEKCSQI